MQCSIVNYKTVKENIDFRYEPEFFLPKYIEYENILSKKKTINLRDCAIFENGRAFDSTEFSFDGNVFISKIGDVTQKREFKLWEKVSKSHFESLKAKYLKHNDILMTLTGDPPDVGKTHLIFNPPEKKLSWNQRVALIRLKKQDKIISPEYLFIALSAKYCREHIERWAKGIRQRNVGNPAVLYMPIPEVSLKFQEHLSEIVKKSFNFSENSYLYYSQAEQILLSEIGLLNWKPKHRLSFVKNFSETKSSDRIDAEYFQPKYDDIVKVIKNYRGGWDTLSNLCSLVGHPSNPPYAESNDKDKTFIVTQKHLGNYSLNDEFWKDEDALYTTNEFVKENSQYILKQDDVLLYSVGAYIGKANIYKEATKATIGSFLTLLRTKQGLLNPYYLMVFLNTNIGVMISKQHQRGMAQQYLYPYDIRTFPIPLLNKEIQIQIQHKITESFNLRKQSKHLLECAKKAVEMAIERDEKTAMKWITEQTEKT